MTKVLLNHHLLAYRQGMQETLMHVIQQKHIPGSQKEAWAEPVLAQKDLLPPPCILAISLEGYKGEGDDLIGIWVDHDFGIARMHVTIWDLQGNRIESGDAYPFSEIAELWWYLPTACVPPGTSVIVEATARDGMGGVAKWWKRKTMGEKD
jgi:hypothetical protein